MADTHTPHSNRVRDVATLRKVLALLAVDEPERWAQAVGALDRLVEQLETLRQERDQFDRWLRFYSDLKDEEIDYMVGNWRMMVGASIPATRPSDG